MAADLWVDCRLENWGQVMRGGYLGGLGTAGYYHMRDELDADVVERGMCRMKAERGYYWRLARNRYIYLWTRDTCAKVVRRSHRGYYDDMVRMRQWLNIVLAEQYRATIRMVERRGVGPRTVRCKP